MKFQEVHKYYERANEDAFLQKILPMISKPCSMIKSRVRADALEPHEEAQYQVHDQDDEDDQEGEANVESQAKLEYQEGPRDNSERKMWKDATIGTHRQMADQQREGSSPAQEAPEFSVTLLWDDGLAVKVNCEFRKSFLPARDNDEELTKAMAKVDGMINSKPDHIYGLRIDHYPIPHDVTLSAHINSLLEVVPTLHHPFFIIEGRSNSGSKAEVENQACRGGATLVKAARELLEKIGTRSTEATGPDQQTFVYSATLSPGLIDIWVHWAEVREKARPIFTCIG